LITLKLSVDHGTVLDNMMFIAEENPPPNRGSANISGSVACIHRWKSDDKSVVVNHSTASWKQVHATTDLTIATIDGPTTGSCNVAVLALAFPFPAVRRYRINLATVFLSSPWSKT